VSLARTANGHYAVDFTGSQYQPAGNFDYVSHDRWAEAGHCPVVSLGGSWCNKPPHDGKVHGSVFVPAENRSPHFVEWEI
jgi:hypothetical protein